MIPIKSSAEIEIMRAGGIKLRAILDGLKVIVKPGITTGQLEKEARKLFRESEGEPTFLGFHGYPASICVSVNDEVVHGIPGSRVLKEGDIVGIDAGLRYKGFCTDSAITLPVGQISPKAQELLIVTKESLMVGLAQAKPGNRVGDISHAIEAAIQPYGFGVVRDLTGHGIGRNQWEEPPIPNFGKAATGPILKQGMTIAIEPMVTLGASAVKQLDDGWTIVTADHSLAAHFEHTIVITVDGYSILT